MDCKVVLLCDAVSASSGSVSDAPIAMKVVASDAVVCAEDPECLGFLTPTNERDFGPLLSGRFHADQLVLEHSRAYDEAVAAALRTTLQGGRLAVIGYGTRATCHGAVFLQTLQLALKDMVRWAQRHSLEAQAAGEARLYQIRVSLIRAEVNTHALFDVLNQGTFAVSIAWLFSFTFSLRVCQTRAS
jgi:hypothetical protein